MTGTRARLWFAKTGDLRFLGHRDLVRTVERWLRRARCELQLSQGFHPRVLLTFPSALSVGIAGEREVMEARLVGTVDREELHARLTATACPQLELLDVELVPATAPKIKIARAHYAIGIPADRDREVEESIHAGKQTAEWFVERVGKKDPIDLHAGLESLALNNRTLHFTLTMAPDSTVHPRDVLKGLRLDDLESSGAILRRVAVELESSQSKRPRVSVAARDLEAHRKA